MATAADALSATVGEDPQVLRRRLLQLVNLPLLSDTDDHDRREVLRELRVCEREVKGAYRARLRRVTRVDRPAGIGRLPRPRSVKPASAAGACGLCSDGYNVGQPGGGPLRPGMPAVTVTQRMSPQSPQVAAPGSASWPSPRSSP